MDKEKLDKIYQKIDSDKGTPKEYGWVRITFHYTMTMDIIKYILNAILDISINGHKYINEYEYDGIKNLWNHKKFKIKLPSFENPDNL